MGGGASDGGDLLRLARAGDAGALGELLERRRHYLHLVSRLQIGNRLQGKLDASDVVQETFLRAHEAFAQFRGDTEPEFESWLRTILASRLDKQFRRWLGTAQRDVRHERAMDAAVDSSAQALAGSLAAPHTSPSSGAARRERVLLVADALARIPADYREVIVMRHFEGLSFAEVAERMQRTLGSVEKLWMRALARLRSLLEAG